MKPLVLVPHPVLSTPAKTVTAFDGKLKNLISDMKETLIATLNPKGVGLAATQVGVGLRVFLTRPTETSRIRIFVNPEIITHSDNPPSPAKPDSARQSKLEGCLSIPNIWGNVHRTSTLTLRYQDDTGNIHEEEFSGFLATIIQHETDHLNGILFTQRALEQKEKLYQVAEEDGKEILEEVKI